jgi:hypothetical protein
MNSPQAQSESEIDPNFGEWTESDDLSYCAWLEHTAAGQQALEDAYWNARAAAFEAGEDF